MVRFHTNRDTVHRTQTFSSSLTASAEITFKVLHQSCFEVFEYMPTTSQIGTTGIVKQQLTINDMIYLNK